MAIRKSDYLQFKATMVDIEPPIWRQFVIPASFTLNKLHSTLQVLFGWLDYHLHVFTIDGKEYGIPDPDAPNNTCFDDTRYYLYKVFKSPGEYCLYEYDFGDGWEISLQLESKVELKQSLASPKCLAGARSGPPEDVGGPYGYVDFLRAINDPGDEMYSTLRNWIGGWFDPEAFNLRAINSELKSIKGRVSSDVWINQVSESLTLGYGKAKFMPDALDETDLNSIAELPLLRDVKSLIGYVRDNKVVGTASTGNFPVKTFPEISPLFVTPFKYIYTFEKGDPIKLYSEFEIAELFFKHSLANSSGLMVGDCSKRWEVTKVGERFLKAKPELQYWHLLLTWWTKMKWFTYSSYEFPEAASLFEVFKRESLKVLRALKMNSLFSFERFVENFDLPANKFFEEARERSGNLYKTGVLEYTLLKPMSEFGVLNLTYEMRERYPGYSRETLTGITLNPLGRKMVDSLNLVVL